jgi:type I restriction enzyme, S subunit
MKLMPLTAIADVSMGSAPPSTAYNEIGNGIPMIAGAGDFGDIHPKPKKWTTETTRLAQRGDLIICVRATIGDLNWADRDYCLGRGVAGIRAKNGISEIEYVARAIEARKRELAKLGTGSTFLAIRKSDLEDFEIPVPATVDEQKRIAAVLDKADALRRQRRESLELTEKLLQSVFIDMFGDPAANPKEWPIHPLGELASKFSDGPFGSNLKTSHYTTSGVRVLRLQNIGVGALKNDDVSFISREHYESLPRHHCKPGDVIVGTMGEPNLRAAVIPALLRESLNKADCVQIRPKNMVTTAEYLCWLLNMPGTLATAQGLVLGETRARVSMGRLKTLKVPLPPFELQQRFGKVVGQLLLLKEHQSKQQKELEALFSSLQRKAFRGELELGRIELDQAFQTRTNVTRSLPLEVRHRYIRSAAFVAPRDIEARLAALDEKLTAGAVGDSMPWDADYFKYRTLNQVGSAPFSFDDIWEAVQYDMEGTNYEIVKAKVFECVADGTLAQEFDETRKEVVFYPRA